MILGLPTRRVFGVLGTNQKSYSPFAILAEATRRPEARGCRATAGNLEGFYGELLGAASGFKTIF